MKRRLTPIGAVILIAAGLATGLVLAEGILRLIGFTFRTFPTVEFGWPQPTVSDRRYIPDRDLFWVPRDYEERLGAARGTGVAVVFMGDSCTEFGDYPGHVLARLAVTEPSLARGVELGVAGWSTEQGLAQLKRDVLPLHPAVITMYFGWNDHWVARGAPDSEARPGRAWFWFSQELRLGRLLDKARLALTTRPLADRPNRVSLSRFRQNLQTMVRLAHAGGIHPVLITAPSNHVPGAEPPYLSGQYLRNLSELVPLHQAYLAETRSVADSEGATLCDAAAAFDALPGPRSRYFISDGIHLSVAGDLEMGTIVAGCIARAAGERSP